jgi:hypothetical protein
LAVELRQTGADDVVPAKVDGRELFVAVEQAAVKRAARD